MKMKLSIAVIAAFSLQAMDSPVRRTIVQGQRDLDRAIALSLQGQRRAQQPRNNRAQDTLAQALTLSSQTYAEEQARRARAQQVTVELQQAVEFSKQSYEAEEAKRAAEQNSQDADLERVIALSKETYEAEKAQQYEREVASREAPVAQQKKEKLEKAQRLSIKRLNEELVIAVKNRAAVTDIQELLDQGADIDACDSQGLTSLMWAVRLGFPDVVIHLMKAGANKEARDRDGQTALIHAEAGRHLGCLVALGVLGSVQNVFRDEITSYCYSKKNSINKRYARLKTGLLCMNRVSDSPIPKDVRRLILCSDSELLKDLGEVFVYRLCKGNALTSFQLNLLHKQVHEGLFSSDFLSDDESTFMYASVGIDSLELFLAMDALFIGELNALQQKALTNNETKENK